LFLTAFVCCFVFFSLAGCKRPGYVLPAMPLLALALACYLDRVLPVAGGFDAICCQGSRLAHAATLLVLAFCIVAGLVAVQLRHLKPLIAIAGAFVAFRGVTLFYLSGRRVSGLLCGATTFVLLTAGLHQGLPGYARRFALRGQVRPHSEPTAEMGMP